MAPPLRQRRPGRRHLALLVAFTCIGVLASVAPALAGGQPPQPDPAVLAHDRGVVAKAYHDCRAFSPRGCQFGYSAWTRNGSGRLLYAVHLLKTAGDSCGLGVVYFFDVRHLIVSTARLTPHAAVAELPRAVRANGARAFVVAYAVNPSKLSPCVAWGSAGTDRYTYRFNGTTMVRVAGHPPAHPKVLAP